MTEEQQQKPGMFEKLATLAIRLSDAAVTRMSKLEEGELPDDCVIAAAHASARCMTSAIELRADAEMRAAAKKQMEVRQALCKHEFHIVPGGGSLCPKCGLQHGLVEGGKEDDPPA